MASRIAAASLRARLTRPDGELALLDVREEGVFSRGHLLTASSLPLSRLEIRVDALVPRRNTAIVVCDGGEGLAERAERDGQNDACQHQPEHGHVVHRTLDQIRIRFGFLEQLGQITNSDGRIRPMRTT